jgi:hypothetical protein
VEKIKAILPKFVERFIMMSLIITLINYVQPTGFSWYYPVALAFGMAFIAGINDYSKIN